MKDKILALRGQGKTYNQIKEALGCSKSTISYYCGLEQKAKTAARQVKLREDKQYTKYTAFKYCSKGVNNKFTGFKNEGSGTYDFSLKDIQVLIRDTPTCYLCGDMLEYEDPSSYHFDHKNPVSRGCKNTLENLGIACRACNLAKSDMTVEEFLAFCKKIAKYNLS